MRPDRRSMQSGFVLIEAIVAIAIVGTALVASIATVSQAMHAIQSVRAADERFTSASRALERASILGRTELEARLGTTRFAGWTLYVGRPMPTLFGLAVADTISGAVLLRTAVYRSEIVHAAP